MARGSLEQAAASILALAGRVGLFRDVLQVGLAEATADISQVKVDVLGMLHLQGALRVGHQGLTTRA